MLVARIGASKSRRWLKESADHVGCFAVAGREEVGVHVERGGGVRVAEATADGADRHACGEQLGRVQVPEIVESYAAQAALSQMRRNVPVIVSGWSGLEPSASPLKTNPSGSNAIRHAAARSSMRQRC